MKFNSPKRYSLDAVFLDGAREKAGKMKLIETGDEGSKTILEGIEVSGTADRTGAMNSSGGGCGNPENGGYGFGEFLSSLPMGAIQEHGSKAFVFHPESGEAARKGSTGRSFLTLSAGMPGSDGLLKKTSGGLRVSTGDMERICRVVQDRPLGANIRAARFFERFALSFSAKRLSSTPVSSVDICPPKPAPAMSAAPAPSRAPGSLAGNPRRFSGPLAPARQFGSSAPARDESLGIGDILMINAFPEMAPFYRPDSLYAWYVYFNHNHGHDHSWQGNSGDFGGAGAKGSWDIDLSQSAPKGFEGFEKATATPQPDGSLRFDFFDANGAKSDSWLSMNQADGERSLKAHGPSSSGPSNDSWDSSFSAKVDSNGNHDNFTARAVSGAAGYALMEGSFKDGLASDAKFTFDNGQGLFGSQIVKSEIDSDSGLVSSAWRRAAPLPELDLSARSTNDNWASPADEPRAETRLSEESRFDTGSLSAAKSDDNWGASDKTAGASSFSRDTDSARESASVSSSDPYKG